MRVFDLTKRFPVEEKYSLTDQFRRASRSVAANILNYAHEHLMEPGENEPRRKRGSIYLL